MFGQIPDLEEGDHVLLRTPTGPVADTVEGIEGGLVQTSLGHKVLRRTSFSEDGSVELIRRATNADIQLVVVFGALSHSLPEAEGWDYRELEPHEIDRVSGALSHVSQATNILTGLFGGTDD